MSARRPLRGGAVLVAAVVVGIVFSAGAQAAPGDLDLTFSGDGKQRTDFGFGLSERGSDRAPARRQDRRGRPHRRRPAARLRARPLQPERLARRELLRRRQADDRLRGHATERAGWRSRATARSSRSGGAGRRDFALARYNPNGSLDTSFSGDGRQTTDFGGFDEANGVALQGDGRIVAVGRAATATSRSPATTRTGRSTRASPATASRRPDFGGLGRGERGGAPGQRQDRRGRRRGGDATSPSPATTPTARSTRASPATAGRRPTSGASTRRTGWRSRATARSSRSAHANRRRLRARPLQPERLARLELLRRRQADDRLRGLRRGERGGAPGRRQDRRGRLRGRLLRRRLRARPLQPERVARHELLRRRQADDRLGGLDGANGVALQGDGKIVAVGSAGGCCAGDFALARYNPNGSLDPSFSGDGRQTTDFGGFDGANGVALQGDGKIVAVGGTGTGVPGPAPTTASRSPATTPTARSTRASPATAGRGPTSRAGAGRSGERGGAPGRRQDRRGRLHWRPSAGATSTSRSPATTRTARSTRASPATASRRPTSWAGTPTWRPRWRSRATARSSRSVGGVNGGFALARYNPNGSLDPSFSGDGKQTTDFVGGAAGERGGAPGRRQDRGSRRQRSAASRSPATTRTARSTRASPATASRGPTSPARNSTKGRMGWRSRRTARSSRSAGAGGAGFADFALARYNPNGTLDPSFSGDGKQRTDFGGSDGANGVALQGGKIVAVGLTSSGIGGDFALARYNPNGRLDASFAARRQEDDRLRGRRPGERGGAPGRQDRRGWRSASAPTEPSISRSPATREGEPLRGRGRAAFRSFGPEPPTRPVAGFHLGFGLVERAAHARDSARGCRRSNPARRSARRLPPRAASEPACRRGCGLGERGERATAASLPRSVPSSAAGGGAASAMNSGIRRVARPGKASSNRTKAPRQRGIASTGRGRSSRPATFGATCSARSSVPEKEGAASGSSSLS